MSIPEIGRIAFICLEVVLLFNLLIFVHELGHFLAGKWRGLYIEEFALWFGKPLWRKKIAGVWYAINSIPAGGYVKLPQMAPMGGLEGEATDLPPEARRTISPLDKIIVAFAGPLFSFLLAFAMATVVWVVGKPESDFDSTTIGEVMKGSPAEAAGLKVGDEILSVDGKSVTHWISGTNSVKWAIIRSEGQTIPFVVKRGGETLTINSKWAKPEQESLRRPVLRQVGITPREFPGVGLVVKKSPAEAAGLQVGDVIVSMNGTPIFNIDDMLPIAQKARGQNVDIVVERAVNGKTQQVPLTLAVPPLPAGKEDGPIDFGIAWGRVRLVHPGPWEQTRESATTIFRMIGALFSKHSDVKAAHFSGPVGIMRIYYSVFQAPEGWRLAVALSVLINVNLALINMLPFPVLDGGHITLAIVEAIRRKPVNVRALEIVQTACALMIIGFMLYVTFFDVGDMFGDRRRAPQKTEGNQPASSEGGKPAAPAPADGGTSQPAQPAEAPK
jgi:regulator of sigma E protease